jgi:hypothetical protein
MPEVVPVVLGAWVVATVALFWWRPGRDAALLALFVGWALLPVASYPPGVFGLPAGRSGSMHALAVPTAILANRAVAVGLGTLLGVVAFDWRALRRLRRSPLDLPVVAWCVLPVVATFAAGLPLAEGLAQARCLALAWGVPYLLGRAYLGDNESLHRFGLAWVAGGLAYAALGLLEWPAGPFLYDLAYGPHPYQLEGAERFLGHRPLVFLEHGNQLGMWTASAAVAAVWLWRSGRLPALGRVPPGGVAAALVIACLLAQSHGAILIAAAALAPLLLAARGRDPHTVRLRAALAIGLASLVLVGGAVTAWRVGSGGGAGLRDSVRSAFIGVGKSSFTWRLARSGDVLPRVAERPLLGWARADWSAAPGHTFFNPVNLGLWLLVLGMYGVAGLTVVALVLALPVVEVVKWLPLRSWLNPACSGVTLAAVLLAMNAADAALNSTLILPVLAGAGGLASWSQRRYEGG